MTRLSYLILCEMRGVQHDADRRRTEAYAEAKRLLDATRDTATAENM